MKNNRFCVILAAFEYIFFIIIKNLEVFLKSTYLKKILEKEIYLIVYRLI